MYSDFSDELRRIRITLIVIAIIMVFLPGSSNVTVDHNYDDMSYQGSKFHKNLVPLGNGYFGLFSGDTELKDDNEMKVYFYDEKENKMMLMREVNLDTVELAAE
ncbi:hypothetical protein ABE41_005060 [Fictibacillus arsenicus]|uniref:Uncharacterized protein n=1 Tax=Fictibacillus arsenicus TaxID=255247 RepID=A0A1B1Z1L4_9BACL|nr:hypothetical protein [Fictibacillus arsenicus]ANX11367.1 hypothetical protein ABE41_005060 [Fictibacillus arsenicus]